MGKFKAIDTDRKETARLAARDKARAECPDCGGLGFTLEPDADYGEAIVGCRTCWARELNQEAEAACVV